MTTLTQRLHRALTGDAGETPVAVMIGLVVFAILTLSAGPVIVSFTTQGALTSGDREVDKALAVQTDSARRLPWTELTALAGTGPHTERVDLAGHATDVTTWVTPDPDSPTRLLVTKAIQAVDSHSDCTTADTPTDLPGGCLTRTAVVTATAQDARPPMSPAVVDGSIPADLAGPAGRDLTSGDDLFTVQVATPTLVTVIARTGEPVVADVVSAAVARATLSLEADAASGDWVIGNAVVCPTWDPRWTTGAVDFTARVRTPASVHAADLLVLTTPAPGASCPA